MEEVSREVKIIGIAICLGAVVLLVTQDRLIKMLRRSPEIEQNEIIAKGFVAAGLGRNRFYSRYRRV